MKIFLLLSTNKIGGAERRFFGLWQSFCINNNDVRIILVGSPELFRALSSNEVDSTSIKKYKQFTIEYDLSGNFEKYQRSIVAFVNEHTQKKDILHFIGDHPLRTFKERIQIYSITQSSFRNLNLVGKIGQLGGVFFSDKIDVLDPNIYSAIKKLFFYKKKNIFRTSNSFCDVNIFKPLPFVQKDDWFVFLGRVEGMKQVIELLHCIPIVYNAIKQISNKEIHFYFLGYGSLEIEIGKLLEQDKFKNLPITIKYTDNPIEILKASKFFFSLQRNNNYPSRSLIEAMSSGNIPIVTDVGQTRWLAKPEFSYYVPERFNCEDILNAIQKIYKEDEKALSKMSKMARKFVIKEHTIEKMGEYYLSIYKKSNSFNN